MRRRGFSLFFFILILCGISCSSQKKLTYFRSVDANAADTLNTRFVVREEPTVVKGDELLIVISAFDPEAAVPFNLPAATFQSVSSDQVYTTQTLQRYKVDKNGDIEMPVLGKMHVEGMTKSALVEMLKGKLQSSIKDPIVNIQFGNFAITVIGEVNKPGRYEVYGERLSVLEALGLAGDMTIYGKRNDVLLTRENNGQLEFARLDLNNPELFMSPYYYLQQNDVIYVAPNNARGLASQNISLYLSMLTSLGSMATVIVSVVSLTK